MSTTIETPDTPDTSDRLKVDEFDNLYQMAVAQFQRAADIMDLSPGLRQILSQPKNELIVNFPVRMDSGETMLPGVWICSSSPGRAPVSRWGSTKKSQHEITKNFGRSRMPRCVRICK